MGLPRFLAAALGAAALAFLPSAAHAATPTTWLCKPGMSKNPCTSPLTTTLISASGKKTVERARPARNAKVDCFYVYPTVSAQSTPNANLKKDPEQIAIAQYQASRFSQTCRVYAPMYRQLTLAAISVPRGASSAVRDKAYGDVRAAWREYLRKYNKGRGVILVGHSQGSFMLRQLVRDEIDRKASSRRKLISAMLLGGNVEVRKGSDRGGDFKNVPACRRYGQVGCVVAWSMFDKTPANPSRFGRATSSNRQVLCTDPTKLLRQGNSLLDTYSRTAPFPGTLGVAINASTTLPKVSTPWIGFPGRSRAHCVSRDGATWLQIDAVPDDPRPVFKATIGDDWGLHLGDVNIAYGQLVELAVAQATSWLNGRR